MQVKGVASVTRREMRAYTHAETQTENLFSLYMRVL
jgi:hypothetical protein